MKKIFVMILILFSSLTIVTGCVNEKNTNLIKLEKKVAELEDRLKILENEKRNDDLGLGYENVVEIEIRKFNYYAKKSFEDRKCKLLTSSHEREYLKKIMRIFDSKVYYSDKEEVIPLDYQIIIYRKNDNEEKYEVFCDNEKAYFLSAKGVKYLVNSHDTKELKYLLENYYPSEQE